MRGSAAAGRRAPRRRVRHRRAVGGRVAVVLGARLLRCRAQGTGEGTGEVAGHAREAAYRAVVARVGQGVAGRRVLEVAVVVGVIRAHRRRGRGGPAGVARKRAQAALVRVEEVEERRGGKEEGGVDDCAIRQAGRSVGVGREVATGPVEGGGRSRVPAGGVGGTVPARGVRLIPIWGVGAAMRPECPPRGWRRKKKIVGVGDLGSPLSTTPAPATKLGHFPTRYTPSNSTFGGGVCAREVAVALLATACEAECEGWCEGDARGLEGVVRGSCLLRGGGIWGPAQGPISTGKAGSVCEHIVASMALATSAHIFALATSKFSCIICTSM